MTNVHIRMPGNRHGGRLGQIIRLVAGAFIVLVTGSVYAAGAKDAVDVRVVRGTPEHVVLETGVKGFSVKPVMIDGKKYANILLGRESRMKEVGAPALPHICRSVIIPDDAQMAVRVLASAYYDIDDIAVAPSKGFISRSVNPRDVPYTFGDEYEADEFFPGDIAALRTPYILRDHRGTVVELNPFQYNPVQRILRVYTSLTVEVVSIGPGQVNVLNRAARPRSLTRSFHQIYSSQFLNYAEGTVAGRYTSLDETGDMLIIAHDAWTTNLLPLENHKELRGIDTTIVGVSSIGNNPTAIKNYIQGVYDTSDLAFVLLVGDAGEVVSPSVTVGYETESADPTYALLAGGDHYPDILIGRFSAQTSAQVDTQVQRTIEYEQSPATSQDWFKKATGVASNEGPGDDGEYDFEHMDNIRADLLAYDYTHVDQIYDPGASASTVSAALNAGRGLVNYTGHGNPYGWGTTGFSTTQVNALVNNGKLPLIVSVACNNGTFDGYTCFAEAWLRATNAGAPSGAVAIYASSVSQHWEPPMCAQDEMVDLLVGEAYTTYGALCFAGSCQMMDEYGVGGVEMYDTWHIFGDPSLRVLNRCSDAGTVNLDREAYGCESEATITVGDCGLNLDSQAVDSVTVTIASDSEAAGENVLLTETEPASAEFTGNVTLSGTDGNGVLLVAPGDTVTVRYTDADDGAGGLNVEVTATAAVDCQPPQISNVQTSGIEARKATVTFDADEPALGTVSYGTSCGALLNEAAGNEYATAATVILTGLSDGITYFYGVEAQDEAGNGSFDDNGGQCYSFTTLDVPDFFTELFETDNDLDNMTLVLTPNGSGDFYSSCAEPITALPTSPDGGAELALADDDSILVSVPGGETVQLYGIAYSEFYVGSNGNITFGAGDEEYRETLEGHFAMPRISVLFDDFNPTAGDGQVLWEAFENRIAVSWLNISEYGYATTSTFQVELFFDGKLRFSYLDISVADGLAGVSAGLGLDPDFFESDLSNYGDCSLDCNENGVPDSEDITTGTSEDCNDNGVPDECEEDCNGTGIPDDCDIDAGTSLDCNTNGIPDECEEDCNDSRIPDDCDIADGTSFDCNINSIPDECDISGGGSVDDNYNGIPDECECPPADAPQTEAVLVTKNRYVSIVPGNAGEQTALRLRFVSLPAPFDVLDGSMMWVGQPEVISDHSGSVDPADAPGWPTFVAAALDCEPFYTDWSTSGTVHVFHEYIVPGGVYEIQSIIEGCHVGLETSYSVPVTMATSAWGDLVENCATSPCGSPDGVVGVTTDVTALVDKFKNLPGSPHKTRTDLEPANLDHVLNITDIVFAVEAFLGIPYPFPGPGVADPCAQSGGNETVVLTPAELNNREPKRSRTDIGR